MGHCAKTQTSVTSTIPTIERRNGNNNERSKGKAARGSKNTKQPTTNRYNALYDTAIKHMATFTENMDGRK